MKPDVGATDEPDRSRWASPRAAEALFVAALLLDVVRRAVEPTHTSRWVRAHA